VPTTAVPTFTLLTTAARRRQHPRRGGKLSARALALALLTATLATAPANADLQSAIQLGSTVTLEPGHELYFYIAATAGQEPIEALSWLADQDLAVNATPTNDQAISIGHGPSPAGSYLSGALPQATAAVALDGYAVTQTYAARAQRRAHQSGHVGRPIKGANLTLHFRTSQADQLTLILIGAQGTGHPKLTGIKADPLQDATYGSEHSEAIACAAAYAVELRPGKHKASISTTTYIPNAGSALGAIAYVLTPIETS